MFIKVELQQQKERPKQPNLSKNATKTRTYYFCPNTSNFHSVKNFSLLRKNIYIFTFSMFYNDAKNQALQRLKSKESEYNNLISKGNSLAVSLYQHRKNASSIIKQVQDYINSLANTPKHFQDKIKKVDLELRPFRESCAIEQKSAKVNMQGANMAMMGTVAGGAIASLTPTAAMAYATTFGIASTGTAISSLSGAAATNAALAFIGGGTVASGAGGIAGGQVLLSLAGPVGWGIAGLLAVASGVTVSLNNKNTAEEADFKGRRLQKKISELRPRIYALEQLLDKTKKLKATFNLNPFWYIYPKDYLQFDSEQKKAIAALINNTHSLGSLINERIV